ncbi:DUF1553 domain-containing protein [Flavobacteriaceae bacterium]|nr:DUF1553 domain-containing protein [Flavobacteriaceae bacterium]
MKSIVHIIFLISLLYSCSIDVPKQVMVELDQIDRVVDFNYDVQPILSDRCYQCHGPDENSRRAGLRLDDEKIAFSKLSSGSKALVSGSLFKSEVAHRILSNDPEEVMPTPESKLLLTNKEKAIILKWIDQGAQWKDHWAFIPPEVNKKNNILTKKESNPIDFFIENKLNENGLTFSEPAIKERLIRRVYFDLTGLPPSIEDVNNFKNDESPKAYEKIIDKLLASEENAERLTMDWLDLSRYADSHGLHADGLRTMWPWRDWVINAFKNNMPYDEFVTKQLAGDLLTIPSRQDIIPTAFNRNTPMTAEGGVVDEEWRLNYVFDRTETFGTAFLGLTVMCAKCHDHKFDPISQRDYYELAAFFNQTKELGMTGDDGDFGPLLLLPEPNKEKTLNKIQEQISYKKKQLELKQNELFEIYSYVDQLNEKNNLESIERSIIQNVSFENFKTVKKKSPDVSYIAQGNFSNQTSYIIDNKSNITSNEMPKISDGVVGTSFSFGNENDVLYLESVPNFESTDSFSGALWLNTEKRKKGFSQTIFGTTGGKNNYWRGWDLFLDDNNYINFRLISSLPENVIHVKSPDSLKINKWDHLVFSYDGSGEASGVKLFLNGNQIDQIVKTDNLYKSIKPVSSSGIRKERRSVKVGESYDGSSGDNRIFKGKMDELFIFNKSLSSFEIKTLFNKYDIDKKLISNELKREHLVLENNEQIKIQKEISKLKKQWLNEVSDVTEIMVMEDMKEPRQSFLYDRGQYTNKSYEVFANTPSVLPKFSEDLPRNRLGLAKWLFEDKNPLTSRVTANRYWQLIFGKGIVSSPEDFGLQGMLPSNAELLDFLANFLVNEDWDIKKLIKLMVTSSTYKQSSSINQKYAEIDPNNIYLWRSNSYRLPAEMIRDNALAASGLLVKKTGGKSVKPYQPDGLWREKSNFSIKLLDYKISETEEDLYRRSLYTFLRRTSPPPSMSVFDAPSREVCTVKREITNTPLQALVLLNDPQFVEASRVLAERIQIEESGSIKKSIEYGFQLCTSRMPSSEELQILKEFYDNQYKKFKSNPKLADQIFKNGRKKRNRSLDKYKTAALTLVANTMLNHDEAYIKR